MENVQVEGQSGAKVLNGRDGCDGEMGKKKEKKSHFTLRVFHHKWTTSTPGPLAAAHNSSQSYANQEDLWK